MASIVIYLLMVLSIAATIFIIYQVAIHHIFSFLPGDYDELRRALSREFSSLFYEFEDELGISFGAYIAYLCTIPMYSRMLLADSYGSDLTAFSIMSPTMNLTLLMTVVMAVVMYFINLYMMTKKLNLE